MCGSWGCRTILPIVMRSYVLQKIRDPNVLKERLCYGFGLIYPLGHSFKC